MKTSVRIAASLLLLACAGASQASLITGDLGGGGNFSGSVNSSNAWIASNALDGDAVNFWTLNANSGSTLSVIVNSKAIEFGMSLYFGLIEETELLFTGFNNAGSFGNNVYVTGTNPVTGAAGTSLLNFVLPTTGLYTLAVGGEQGFDFGGSFAYDMQVTHVPEPSMLALFGASLLVFAWMRRRV